MSVDFRGAMRRFPTGVTVVTTVLDGRPKGFTASAFTSVSADPPMVLICVNRSARTHALISLAGRFCVNVLRLEQEAIARRFARGDAGGDPFEDLAYAAGATGSPVLAGTLAHVDCELAEEHSAGTHTIFVGGVVGAGAAEGSPLGYFDAGYRDFACATS